MMTAEVLERAGAWRTFASILLLVFCLLPAVPLTFQALTSAAPMSFVFTPAFQTGLGNSLEIAILVCILALVAGLPTGAMAALYVFPGRTLIVLFAALPLLVPSTLWSIGWSAAASRFPQTFTIGTKTACTITFIGFAFSLVFFATLVAANSLTASQLQAARLAGGERTAFGQAVRHAAIPALLAAIISGVLTLSDPGPGQIFGFKTVAAEILVNFSALYDFDVAARQCFWLTIITSSVVVPMIVLSSRRIAAEVLARQSQGNVRVLHSMGSKLALASLLLFLVLAVAVPCAGLMLPMSSRSDLLRALAEAQRTTPDTLIYMLGSGLLATTIGLLLAGFVARNSTLRLVCCATCLALLVFPPSFLALGAVAVSTDAPAWADPVVRGRLAVVATLGLRFVPLATILLLRAWASTSSSWAHCAGVHGVPLSKYLRRVLIPVLGPSIVVSVFLVALLAGADVVTTLLVHPPGHPSLSLAIFTVMANAPESLVASLCAVHMACALIALVVVRLMARNGGLR